MKIEFLNPDEVHTYMANLPAIDTATADQAHDRQQQLTKPPGSLGRLEDLAIWLAGWQGGKISPNKKFKQFFCAVENGFPGNLFPAFHVNSPERRK